MSKVTRIDMSPMNRERWVVTLECGHEEWVTARRRPTRRRMKCTRCERGRPWKRRQPVRGMRKPPKGEGQATCACGHVKDEHGMDPDYPGSTACTVEGCGCIAFEGGQQPVTPGEAPWNPCLAFDAQVRLVLPGAQVEYDRPSDPAGNHVWDIERGGKELVVEWRRSAGFGITCDPTAVVYGDHAADEYLQKPEDAVARVAALLKSDDAVGPAKQARPRAPTLKELAARIDAHLKRFEADKKINVPRKTPHSMGEGLRPFYMAGARASGPRVFVTYVSFQGQNSLTKAQAVRYLAWLDQGNVGRHHQVVGR